MPKQLSILLVAFHILEQTSRAAQNLNGSCLRKGKKSKTLKQNKKTPQKTTPPKKPEKPFKV